jgi:hypothetical protein
VNPLDELDEESRALLGVFGGGEQPAYTPPEDPIVLDQLRDEPPAAGLGAKPAAPAVDTSAYVPRADFDRIAAQITELQKKMGEGAARQAQAPPAYQPPQNQGYPPPGNVGGPIDPNQAKQDFNNRFFADPAGALLPLMQSMFQEQGRPFQQAQVQTQTAVAHQTIQQMRTEFATSDPDLARAVLARVDAEVAATPPEQLARLVTEGRLRAVYEDVVHREVGKQMRFVYRAAAAKKNTATAPPPMGGGSLNNATDLASRRRNGPIRQSEISDVDRVAIEQAKRFGISAETILGIETA